MNKLKSKLRELYDDKTIDLFYSYIQSEISVDELTDKDKFKFDIIWKYILNNQYLMDEDNLDYEKTMKEIKKYSDDMLFVEYFETNSMWKTWSQTSDVEKEKLLICLKNQKTILKEETKIVTDEPYE